MQRVLKPPKVLVWSWKEKVSPFCGVLCWNPLWHLLPQHFQHLSQFQHPFPHPPLLDTASAPNPKLLLIRQYLQPILSALDNEVQILGDAGDFSAADLILLPMIFLIHLISDSFDFGSFVL